MFNSDLADFQDLKIYAVLLRWQAACSGHGFAPATLDAGLIDAEVLLVANAGVLVSEREFLRDARLRL